MKNSITRYLILISISTFIIAAGLILTINFLSPAVDKDSKPISSFSSDEQLISSPDNKSASSSLYTAGETRNNQSLRRSSRNAQVIAPKPPANGTLFTITGKLIQKISDSEFVVDSFNGVTTKNYNIKITPDTRIQNNRETKVPFSFTNVSSLTVTGIVTDSEIQAIIIAVNAIPNVGDND